MACEGKNRNLCRFGGILGFARIFGLAPFTIGSDRSRSKRSKTFSAYNVIVAILILFNTFLAEQDTRNDKEYANMSMLIGVAYDVADVFGNIYISYSLLKSVLHAETSISAWFKLKQIDEILSTLSIRFDYQQMKLYTYLKFSIFSVVAVLFAVSEIICCARVEIYYTVSYWLTSLLPLGYGAFVASFYGCTALALFQRYWVVNYVLEESVVHRTEKLFHFSSRISIIHNWSRRRVQACDSFRRKKPSIFVMLKKCETYYRNDENLIAVIKALKSVHFELFQLINDANGVFGTHFLFLFVYWFFSCTINIYFVIVFHLRPFDIEQYVSSCMWTLTLLFLTSYVVFFSNLATNEAQRTTNLIHEVLNKAGISEMTVQEELNSFSSQLIQCSAQVKASGFFDINSNFLFQFITGVLSSVVFVVQFDKVNFKK